MPMTTNEAVHSPHGGLTVVPWTRCKVCPGERTPGFKSPREFVRHLRDFHCTKEGGSFVCRYGTNGVCPSLPLEGVSDRDYEDHVAKDHVAVDSVPRRDSQSHSRNSSSSSLQSAVMMSPMQSYSHEPSLVQDQYKWNIYMSRVNLPAALNDPRLSRRETDFFTKTWGESFDKVEVYPSPHIPHITKEHFRKYLKKTTGRLKVHAKTQSDTTIPGESDHRQDSYPSLQARKFDNFRAELEQIPKIFMHPGFTLENPDTFNAVLPWTQIESSRQLHEGATRQSSKLLQEKLSHYLDLVEVQIAKQISMRSDAFFQAMTSHDKLQERLSTTCDSIKQLRERVQQMDSSMVEGPLRIMKLSRTRANYITLYNKLKMMATVHQTQPTIQLLLSTSEYVGALDLIATTQEVLTQELVGVHSFRHLGSQLSELQKLIDIMMQGDFVHYITTDLNRALPEMEKQLDENYADDGSPLELSETQEKLVAIVLGMLRQHHFEFIDIYREEACTGLKAILKQTVIEAVAEAEDIDADTNSGSLADQMRLLHYSSWMSLLNKVFSNLLIVLRRVKAVVMVMAEVLRIAAGQAERFDVSMESDVVFDSATTNGHSGFDRQTSQSSVASSVRLSVTNDVDVMISQAEYIKVNGHLKDVLCQICDHAHDRCVKLLVARSKDGFLEKLTSAEFVELSRSIEHFVVSCEDLCGRRSTSLRASLQSQGSRFVNRFHEERKTKLSLILDNERWKQADVPVEFQDLVDHITHTVTPPLSGQFIAPHLRRPPLLGTMSEAEAGSEVQPMDGQSNNPNKRSASLTSLIDFNDSVLQDTNISGGKLCLAEKKVDSDRKPQEFLLIDEVKYTVVGTVLMLLKMVVEYCEFVDDIPTATSDILSRLIELLKMFNSRTCQLILGAGALQLVGLKTITTKNLALASRCLQLVEHFLPIVRKHFDDKLPPKQANMVKHFDHVLKDYKDHIAEIGNKLVAIMESMVESSLNKWEVKAPMPSQCFRAICRQMGKLHEAICDLLPKHQVKDLFERIHATFKICLRNQLIKLGVSNDGGPQHGLVMADLAFYKGHMQSLAGLETFGDNIDAIWEKR